MAFQDQTLKVFNILCPDLEMTPMPMPQVQKVQAPQQQEHPPAGSGERRPRGEEGERRPRGEEGHV